MRNRRNMRAPALALLIVGVLAACGNAQLRIVDYNTAGVNNVSAMTTVIAAMNNESINGVVKPIDVIVLQELGSGDLNSMLNILNGQGFGTYAAGNVGTTTGAGSVGLIYRTQTIQPPINQQQVVNTSSSGAARGVMRYQLRPVGYDANADFYIYNSHYKASDSGSAANRRNVEATAIRANADALGQGAHIIYAGDFNIYRSSEPMWATLTSAGNGQAFDPVNQVGSWHDGSAFISVHTQNPAGTGGVGGGMDDRFDWQMVTGELIDGEGMSIIADSYHAFGNNGTHVLNGHINTGTGAASAVLNALGAASDHLPVVAQYQVPAKMSVAVSSVPPKVLVGASLAANVNISNSAGDGVVVVSTIGADELDYTVTASGASFGSINGSDYAFGDTNDHGFVLDTTTAGAKSATFSTVATSPQVPNPTSAINRSYNVLDHATPSFTAPTLNASLIYDFGSFVMGDAAPIFNFDIFNLTKTPGFTANMDFDGIVASGDSSILTTDLATSAGSLSLSAGTSHKFTAIMSTAAVGSYSAIYTLMFSDDDLPGELSKSLTLTLMGKILTTVLAGDYNDDGVVDAADYVVWRKVGINGQRGYADWRANFGMSSFGSGSSFSPSVISVPEPTPTTLFLLTLAGMQLGIPRRRSPQSHWPRWCDPRACHRH